MQAHHGFKLKNLIEKSKFKFVDIQNKLGMYRTSLYRLFEKDDLTRKEIAPILELLNVSIDDFYGITEIVNTNELSKEIERLKNRETELLSEIINLQKKLLEKPLQPYSTVKKSTKVH